MCAGNRTVGSNPTLSAEISLGFEVLSLELLNRICFRAKHLTLNSKLNLFFWRDARVVEWNSLENCLTRKGNEGSNPSLSALIGIGSSESTVLHSENKKAPLVRKEAFKKKARKIILLS